MAKTTTHPGPHAAPGPAGPERHSEPRDQEPHGADDLNRLSVSATLHCMTGCVIGEIAGLAIGTALGWSDLATIALAISLAFLFGYSLTSLPLFRAGLRTSRNAHEVSTSVALVASKQQPYAADVSAVRLVA